MSAEAGLVLRIEVLVGRILTAGVALSAALLVAGLALSVARAPGRPAAALLHAGLVVLIGTPVARVLVAGLAFLRERDWLFAGLALVVLGVLASAVLLALTRGG